MTPIETFCAQLESEVDRDCLREEVRVALAAMSASERAEFLRSLAAGYCRYCGDENRGRTCHCENEE